MRNAGSRGFPQRIPVRNGRLGLTLATLLIAGCGDKPVIELPTDPQERAATCYAAKLAIYDLRDGKSPLTAEQANEATHFLLLGASADGIAEPARVQALAARGQALQPALVEKKSVADYAAPCAKAYPETAATRFAGLAPDGPDTRMMCFALANALGQIYRASGIAQGGKAEAYVQLDAALDTRISDEIRSAGPVDPAELLGRATRGLAAAAQAGPPTQVMDACVARYLKP